MRVVVIGAGLGGLAATCHLAGRGHEVVVVEAGSVPGGRAGLREVDGFRFDTGPSVLTMTGLLADTFAAAGADMADHLRLSPVDPMYRAVFADGTTVHVRHGREAMTAEIRQQCGPAEAVAFGRFCDWLGELYRLELPNFIDRNFDSPLDLARPLKPAIDLVRLGGFRKLANVVDSYFADERLRRLFSFQALYAGLSPFEALAVYSIITYMDTVEGVWFPEGGMHAIPRGLAAAATAAGAAFRYGERVERIERPGAGPDRLRVRLASGERLGADAVVANPDLPEVYRTLLPGLDAPRAARKGQFSPSCVVWHVGAKGSPPAEAAHHNIHFGGAWARSFTELLTDGTAQSDPSILITIPTVGDASLAPEGHTALFVLEPCGNLDGRADWTIETPRVMERLRARVAGLGYPVDDIVVEEVVGPDDWEQQGMARGTPFALSHRFRQTGPFRPGNADRRVPGLVLVGSGTVPGVGVPMVLLSGRLAAERVAELDQAR